MALFRRGMHFGSYGTVDDGAAVFGRLAEAVRAAEAAGFDAVSVPDHVHQNQVGGGPDSPMFDAYTLLGALATQTTTVRLFALVSPVTLRHPGLLAKAVTALDVLSRGRALLGIGAGWDVAESEAYGISFPSAGERFDRLEEALAICDALLTGGGPRFPGSSTRCATRGTRRGRCTAPFLSWWQAAGSAAHSTSWRGTGTRATCSPRTPRRCGTSSRCSTGTVFP